MSNKNKYSISERKIFLRVFDISFVIITVLLLSNFTGFVYFDSIHSNLIVWFITLCLYMLFFGQIVELYNLKVSSSRFLVLRSASLTAFFVTIFYIFTPIISPELPENRIQILYLFGSIFIPITLWRFFYITFITLPKYHKYLLLVGQKEQLISLINLIERNVLDNKIIGYVSDNELDNFDEYSFFDASKKNIKDIVLNHYVSEVIIIKDSGVLTKNIHNQLIELFENGTPILSARKYIEKVQFYVPELDINDPFYDYLAFSKSHQNNLYLTFIRILNYTVSIVGILFLIIISPLIFIGNLIGNKGSFFYFQKRVGKNGKTFRIIKLRTMIKDAEANGAVWAAKNDKRITSFGKFLRKTRLDEIPQFINVLRGDMSLIGPRPERLEFVKQLEEQLPFYAIRHIIKPGLTGWAQVMLPYANTLDEQRKKLQYDLYYVKKRDFLLDFRIVVKTINTVLYFKGQ